MKFTIKQHIIFTAITVSIFATFVALAVSGINPWIILVLGAAIFIVGIVTKIAAGKKDNDKLLVLALILVALGGLATLISLLTIIGFFNGLFI